MGLAWRVDRGWAKERLEEYLGLLTRFSPRTTPSGQYRTADRSVVPELQAREPTVREILRTLDPQLAAFKFDPGRGTPLSDIEGRVRRGLGILADREEWAIRLAPDAPQLTADRLHPWVWDPARSLWESKHFRQAVLAGWNAVNARLQEKIGRRDVSEDKLIQEAFSEDGPKEGAPRLRLPGDQQDQTVRSRQRGARMFGLGWVFAIRNPAAHEDGEWDEQVSLEHLAALSVLAQMIDESEVVRAQGEE